MFECIIKIVLFLQFFPVMWKSSSGFHRATVKCLFFLACFHYGYRFNIFSLSLSLLMSKRMMSSAPQESTHDDQVVALVAIANTYRNHFYNFSDHLSILEDIFFFEDKRHQDLFLLSARLLNPVIPATELEQEAAQSRFVHLLKTFETTVEEDLSQFAQESNAVRQLYQSLISAEQKRWNEAEAARKDEFIALTELCRREVSAVVARVKAETAQTTSELEAIGTLKTSLDAKSDEVEALRKHINAMITSHEEQRKQWLDDIARERESSRSLVQADRELFTQQLQTQVKHAEADRIKFHDEINALSQKHSHNVEQLRSHLMTQQDECDRLRQSIDQMGMEHNRELRVHSEERNRLMRMITDLEINYETLKRSLSDVENEAVLNQLNLEHMTETRKLLEVQSFKKRLADTTKLLSSSIVTSAVSSPRRTPRSGYDGAGSPSTARGESVMVTSVPSIAPPPPYREPSISILKSAANSSSVSRSRSPASSITLRSPSDTFLRLSNINRPRRVDPAERSPTANSLL